LLHALDGDMISSPAEGPANFSRNAMNYHRINIILFHSDPVVKTGLIAMLECEEELELSSGEPPATIGASVIIADYHRGLRFGTEALCMQGDTAQRILVVTHHDNDWDVQRALSCGVHGYLLQSDVPDELIEAVKTLFAGGHYLSRTLRGGARQFVDIDALTGREREVLQLLGMGYCNKLIARELGISLSTVKNHMKAVLMKLKVTARTHAVIVAAQRGLLRIDSAAAGLQEQHEFGQTVR
jgi:DNA-binding NarL/FixJ family response regulator